MTHEDLQELLLIAALNFSQSRPAEFYDYLEQNHPYLYQVYCNIQGEG